MKEEFLQFLWKHKLYSNQLKTENGSFVQVISPGIQNYDSGPDFFNAKILIGTTVWAGNVEIHYRSSDWIRHNHHTDIAYDNIILHVVVENDVEIKTTNGVIVETLCIKYSPILANNYQKLLDDENAKLCLIKLSTMPSVKLNFWLDRLLFERLEQKTLFIHRQLEENSNDWNEVFYQVLARNFGFKINSIPFELLSKIVSLKILFKHKDDLFQIETLLFGASGLLYQKNVIEDEYLLKMRNEYNFLQKKYKLNVIDSHLWKFARMRPFSFPTLRIAQFAQLIYKSHFLFSKIIELDDLKAIKALLNAETSEYWDTHYQFGNISAKGKKKLGMISINSLIINTVVPFLFVYADLRGDDIMKYRAIRFLEEIPSENNSIIKNWRNAGVESKSALHSQALIQLHNEYCQHKKCLRCSIGASSVID